MKAKIYALLLASLLVFTLAESGPASGQRSQWKGKIDTVNGLKVIRNPNAPLSGDLKLDLKEDLQIGKEDVENYIFERILSVKAAEDGSIYVLDYKAGNIRKYDRNGVYLQTIGKKGQGPGEFPSENPRALRGGFDPSKSLRSVGDILQRYPAQEFPFGFPD
jgi:hypothetical protein